MSNKHAATLQVQQFDCFILFNAPTHDSKLPHLFFVLSDLRKNPRHVLVMNLSTVRPGIPHDDSCYLHPGDHPFICQKSYVVYARAQIVSVKRLHKLIAEEIAQPYPFPIGEEVDQKIRNGLANSLAAPKIKTFYARYH